MDQTILFDLETTAIGRFGETPDRIHVAVLHEFETGKRAEFLSEEMEEVAHILTNAEYAVAHNALGFDINVMKERTSYEDTQGLILDTLVLCNMFEGDIKEKVDYERYDRDKADKKPTDPHYFSGQLIGSQGLEAWGMRLGKPKDNYKAMMIKKGLDPWTKVNDDMIAYCHTDVDILVLLWERLLPYIENPNLHQAIECEHIIQTYMSKLEKEGTFFDVGAANNLVGELQTHVPKINKKIQAAFPPKIEPLKWIPSSYIGNQKEGEKGYDAWERNYINSCRPYERYYPGGNINVSEMGEVFTPKRTMYSPQFECDRIKHASYCKIATKVINPGSRVQLTRRLKAQGWVPTKFTDAGNPQLDEDVLTEVARTIPAATVVARLYLLNKRLSQISTGPEAWLKKVAPDGRIHPRIAPCATITHRPTHSKPNMSQVPSVQFKLNEDKESVIAFGEEGGWGYECRALFVPPQPEQIRGEKWVQVGSDLAGLELRCLAHYLWEFDGGEFANVLLNEDVHSNNQKIMGLANRTDAKSVIFALLYGAGNLKIGTMLFPELRPEMQMAKGKMIRAKLMAGITGFSRLNMKYTRQAEHKGRVTIIDGRTIPVRNAYSALNTLLQSTGAVLAKYWIKEMMRGIEEDMGLVQGYDGDYQLLGWFHDEVQFACKKEYAQQIADWCEKSSLIAGADLNFALKLESESKVGGSWAECH